jgi:hypothetical protein
MQQRLVNDHHDCNEASPFEHSTVINIKANEKNPAEEFAAVRIDFSKTKLEPECITAGLESLDT